MKRNIFFFGISISILTFYAVSLAQYSKTDVDTVSTASGLKYIILVKGNGTKADSGKEVEVHYNWYLTNGMLIGSSIKTGHPFDFILGRGRVIKGWDEGISYMHVGGHFMFIIPPQLGYGEKGADDIIPPNATLIYDTYLLSVGEPKEEFVDTLLDLTLEKGVDTAIAVYHGLYRNRRDKYNFKEDQLNILGYKLLLKERRDEAIAIFKLNIEMYPSSPGPLDNLGEAYLRFNSDSLALENFEKALQLDPNDKVARSEIARLKGKR